MNKHRLVDKDILCEYDLEKDLLYRLGFDEIDDIVPLRKIYIVITSQGRKIIKLVDVTDKRLMFIDKALNYIRKGFGGVLTYSRTRENKLYTDWNSKRYTVLDMLDGREVNFSNPIEVENCSKALALYHKSCNGIEDYLEKKELEENSGKNLIDNMKANLEFIISLKSTVIEYNYKNEFDNLFLNNVDYYIEETRRAIELLTLSQYRYLLSNPKLKVLCHNDLAHHNFIIYKEEVKLIDFDYCAIDTRVVDMWNYILKAIKNLNYDLDIAKSILESYNQVEKLTDDEIKVIYCLISYPKDFVTITLDYYKKKKNWSEEIFISRFKNKLSLEYSRKRFLGEFLEFIDSSSKLT